MHLCSPVCFLTTFSCRRSTDSLPFTTRPTSPAASSAPHPSAESHSRAVTSKPPARLTYKELQQEIASRPRPPSDQPKAPSARALPSPPPSTAPIPRAPQEIAAPAPLVSDEILSRLWSRDPAVVAAVLPPLPSPATSRPQRQSPRKPGKAREEYVADKSNWRIPERDLKMKEGFPPIWCLVSPRTDVSLSILHRADRFPSPCRVAKSCARRFPISRLIKAAITTLVSSDHINASVRR